MDYIKNRLPPFAQTYLVFSVIAFMIYGWTITDFLYSFPSYVNFLTPGEIMIIFAYGMTSAFLESLMYISLLLCLCLILPTDSMRNVFLTRGTCSSIVGIGYLMVYIYVFSQQSFSLITQLPFWSFLGLALTIAFTYYSTRLRGVADAAAWVSDRLSIFPFLLTPLSIISFLIVSYRHIL